MDDEVEEEMHLDLRSVNVKSEYPLQIHIDKSNGALSGYFFNFHNHKPEEEEMHLDLRSVNVKSEYPLQIHIDKSNGALSGHFFNFHNHKPTFKLLAEDQETVLLTGGSLTVPYVMNQFHFHVYCTRGH